MLVATLVGCAGGAEVTTATTRPTTTEPTTTSTTVAVADPDLDELAARAEAGGSHCLVVTRRGETLGEWYWTDTDPDTPHETFSITKSLVSLLVGIARADGLLSIDDPVSTWVPEWRGTPSESVTVRHILESDSGRRWELGDDGRTSALTAPDATAFAVSLPQDAPPGEVWAYNNEAVQVLSAVLAGATGQDVGTYAQEELLDPLGMTSSSMSRDPAGNTLTFMGLRSTCGDAARLGQLVLQQGRWEGQQLVPAAWVAASTRPATPHNDAYGYLWWLNRRGRIAGVPTATAGEEGRALHDGQVVPDAPEDVVWALGLGDQVLAMMPSLDVVAVRLGPVVPPEGSPPFRVDDLTRLVLAAFGED